MSIASSIYEVLHQLDDGRSYIKELHTDSTGIVHQIVYLAPIGFDYVTRLAFNATSLSQDLGYAEAERVIDG